MYNYTCIITLIIVGSQSHIRWLATKVLTLAARYTNTTTLLHYSTS